MGIFESLRIEHAALRGLLDEMLEDSSEDWELLRYDLKLSLFAHNRAEESVLYDALRAVPHRSEMADIKTEEHRVAEELVDELQSLTPADSEWAQTLSLVKNALESHFAEEETLVFTILEPFIADEEAERMSTRFEKLRDEAIQDARYHPQVPFFPPLNPIS